MRKRISVAGPRATEPGSTRPPTRIARSAGSRRLASSLGLKKNTRLSWKANRLNAVAVPSPTRNSSRTISRRRLRVIPSSGATAAWCALLECRELPAGAPLGDDARQCKPDQHQCGDAVGRPDIAGIAAHGEEG